MGRKTTKTIDQEKQEEKCQANQGRLCSEDKECKKICDELFSTNSHETACLKLPEETVSNFEELLEEMTEKGRAVDMDLHTLECLLDIDDTEFARAIRKLPREEAEKFLIEIAEDKNLARILEEEDDEFNILKQVFSRAGLGNRLRDVLTEELEDDKSFFHIVADDENKPAYKWVEEYVEEICEERGDTLQCPGKKKLGAYCKAFLQHYRSYLSRFLSQGDLFEEDYRSKLKSGGHKWTVSGFKDFCRDEYSVTSSSSGSGNGNGGGTLVCTATRGSTTSACPSSSPPSECKLADVTLATVGNRHIYTKSGGFTILSGVPEAQAGSIDPPSIDKIGQIFRLETGLKSRIMLSSTEISELAALPAHTWYLYMDGRRYAMTPMTRIANLLATVYRFTFADRQNIVAGQYSIHLAYEDSSNHCHWIRP